MIVCMLCLRNPQPNSQGYCSLEATVRLQPSAHLPGSNPHWVLFQLLRFESWSVHFYVQEQHFACANGYHIESPGTAGLLGNLTHEWLGEKASSCANWWQAGEGADEETGEAHDESPGQEPISKVCIVT